MIDFKELARIILQGWCDRNNTAESERQQMEDYYRPLVNGNEDNARIVALFGEWANDLMSIFGSAPHIRLTIEVSEDGKWTVEDVPNLVIQPDTTPDDYYWSCGEYRWDEKLQDMTWRRGKWKLTLEARDRLDGKEPK